MTGFRNRFEKSEERINKAFQFYNFKDWSEVPIITQTSHYFLIGRKIENIPKKYYKNIEVQMEYQLKGIKKHLESVEDDYIPYLMPWYGTGILPSFFGCEIKYNWRTDPAVKKECIHNLNDLENISCHSDFRGSSLTKKVIEMEEYFKINSTIPISFTDPQSPLDCVTLMCGHTNFCYLANDYPEKIKQLIGRVTDTFINWIKFQKNLNGSRLDECEGVIYVKPPTGIGIWMADDDLIMIPPKMYNELFVRQYSKIYKTFGGGILHWCGNALHQLDNLLEIEGLRAVHNSSMFNLDSIKTMQKKFEDRIVIILGDICPIKEEIDNYYGRIKKELNPKGIVIATSILEDIGMNKDGGCVGVNNNPIETANRILEVFRG